MTRTVRLGCVHRDRLQDCKHRHDATTLLRRRDSGMPQALRPSLSFINIFKNGGTILRRRHFRISGRFRFTRNKNSAVKMEKAEGDQTPTSRKQVGINTTLKQGDRTDNSESSDNRDHPPRSPSYTPSSREEAQYKDTQRWAVTTQQFEREQSDPRHPSPPARTRAELEDKVSTQRELIATLRENCRLLERMQATVALEDATGRGVENRPPRADPGARRAASQPARPARWA